MKRLIFFFASLLIIIPSIEAQNVKIDKIIYNLDSSSQTAEVTYYVKYDPLNSLYVSGDIIIPEQVVYEGNTYSVVTIGDWAFAYCGELTTVEIPSSITSIRSNAFYQCDGLTRVKIPTSVSSMGDYVFYRCSALTTIEIPNSITEIGMYAFYRCSALISVEIPNSVTSIRDYAFFRCSALKSADIPNSVTSIGKGAFSDCTGLISISFNNEDLLRLDTESFSGCNYIEIIYCNSPTPPISNDFSVFSDEVYSNTILSVPRSALSLYYEATPWSRFSNIEGVGDITEVEIHFEGSSTLQIGEELQLSLSPKDMPGDMLDAIWSSSNSAVATVSDNGLVTAVAAGTCRITATYGDASASCEVTVMAEAGVNDIFTATETFTIFTINGVLVKKEASAEDVDALSPGIYIVNEKKIIK